jgi:hypothetical protein
MKILFDHSHLGLEFDWLACDRFDRCVFLSTAGHGWLPESAIGPSYPPFVMDLVLALPVRCEVIMRGDPGSSTEWSDVARRGFYAFDWDHQNSKYTLIAEPEVPLLTPELPLELLRTVGRVVVEMDMTAGAILRVE